jgi:hypothetical protein
VLVAVEDEEEEDEEGASALAGVAAVEDAWSDFSCSCFAFCWEVATAP